MRACEPVQALADFPPCMVAEASPSTECLAGAAATFLSVLNQPSEEFDGKAISIIDSTIIAAVISVIAEYFVMSILLLRTLQPPLIVVSAA